MLIFFDNWSIPIDAIKVTRWFVNVCILTILPIGCTIFNGQDKLYQKEFSDNHFALAVATALYVTAVTVVRHHGSAVISMFAANQINKQVV